MPRPSVEAPPTVLRIRACCMAKDRKKSREQKKKEKAQRLAKRQQRWAKPDIHKEIAYIIGRAQEGDARVVTLGSLILFSTPTKDAWLLDAEDGFATCLAEEGVVQPTRIIETETQFGIDWDQRFQVEEDRLIIVNRAGQTTTMEGLPEVLDAIESAR